MKKRGLGKGLDALIPPAEEISAVEVSARAAEGAGVQRISIERIVTRTGQPRQRFAEDNLRELADSIREKGVIQPILVRRKGMAKGSAAEKFQILVGERRYRAAKIAGVSQIPAIVIEASDRDALELALVENLQREDLNPMEEARAYQRLIEEFGLGQEEVSKRVGRSRAAVANALRLLKLPVEVQDALEKGDLSPGHARAILSLKELSKQMELKSRIVSEGLSVREAEELARRLAGEGKTRQKEPGKRRIDPGLLDIEEKLLGVLGTKVRVKPLSQEKGKIEIYYSSLDEVDRLLELLGVSPD